MPGYMSPLAWSAWPRLCFYATGARGLSGFASVAGAPSVRPAPYLCLQPAAHHGLGDTLSAWVPVAAWGLTRLRKDAPGALVELILASALFFSF